MFRAKEFMLNTVTGLAGVMAILSGISMFRRGLPIVIGGSATVSSLAPVRVPGWETLLTSGRRVGSQNAQYVLVEFGDFECPACAGFTRVIDSLRSHYGSAFAVEFHHFPLPYHPLALPLARAAECAYAQGRFGEFYDVAYRKQRELGLLTVDDLGPLSGVADTAEFRRCTARTTRFSQVDTDFALARKMSVPGTPGIIINGLLYKQSLTVEDIERLLEKRPQT